MMKRKTLENKTPSIVKNREVQVVGKSLCSLSMELTDKMYQNYNFSLNNKCSNQSDDMHIPGSFAISQNFRANERTSSSWNSAIFNLTRYIYSFRSWNFVPTVAFPLGL